MSQKNKHCLKNLWNFHFKEQIEKCKLLPSFFGMILPPENKKCPEQIEQCKLLASFLGMILSPKNKKCPNNLWNFDFYDKKGTHVNCYQIFWHDSVPKK